MQNWMTQFMSDYGYLAIFLLIAFENIFPPIPSELILTFAGFLITSTNMNFIGVVISATLGALVGAILLYSLGYLLKIETIESILDGKIGKILGFKRDDVEKATTWFKKRGPLTVLFTRFIPVVRSLISIPAGISRMPLVPFSIYTTIGTAIWNVILIWLGQQAGANWEHVMHQVEGFSDILKYVLIAVGIGAIGFIFYRKSKKQMN